jgi:hypothetical protein
MKAKNLNLDDIKRMQDPSSDLFKEIVLPCVEEAKGSASKGKYRFLINKCQQC